MKAKEYLNIFNKDEIDKLPVNYRLLTKTGGDRRFICFSDSVFYQSKIVVKDYYKPIILTNIKDSQ